MRSWLEAFQQGREEKRMVEPRVAPTSGRPGRKSAPIASGSRFDRASDRGITLLMCIEHPSRPVGGRERAGNEVCDRDSSFGDERLLLCGDRRFGLVVGLPVEDDAQATSGNARLDLHRDVEWSRSHLLEPEAQLLDEVEGEAVAPGRPRRDDDGFELHRLTRLDNSRERSARTVPHDCIAERIEPVIRELHAVPAPRTPRGRAGVLKLESSLRLDTSALLGNLVCEPANREWTHGDGVLADALH